jgi:hypothetical protein
MTYSAKPGPKAPDLPLGRVLMEGAVHSVENHTSHCVIICDDTVATHVRNSPPLKWLANHMADDMQIPRGKIRSPTLKTLLRSTMQRLILFLDDLDISLMPQAHACDLYATVSPLKTLDHHPPPIKP